MLDSEGFVSAGWVYDLMLFTFHHDNQRKFLMKSKVSNRLDV